MGSSFFSRHIYNSKAEGYEAASPILFAAVLYTFCSLVALYVAMSNGWRPFSCSAGNSVDTRDEFLARYDKQGLRPRRTPRLVCALFGSLIGCIMLGR